MTTILFRNASLRIAAGVISCAFFGLGSACSDDGSGPTYSVPAAAGAAGTLSRGSGTLIPAAPGGGVPDVNAGNAGRPGLGIGGASGSGAGSGGLSGFSTAGTAGSFGNPSGGAAGASDIGSAGVAGMAGTAGTSGLAGMGGEGDLP